MLILCGHGSRALNTNKMKVVVACIAICLFSTLPNTNAAKIAVIVFPNGPSHNFMMEKIGQELISRDHEVTYILCSMEPYSQKAKVNKLIYDVPQYPINHYIDSTIKYIIKNGSSGVSIFFNGIIKVLKDACDSLLSDQKLLAQLEGYDLVFADNSYFGCGQLLKEKVGIPLIVDFSAWGIFDVFNWQYGVQWPVSYIPGNLIPQAENMPFLWRTVNLIAFALGRSICLCSNAFGVGSLKYKHRLAEDKSFSQLIGDTDLLLIPLDWALEWSRPLPPNAKLIGPTQPRPAKRLPDDLESFMQSAGRGGVVLVSYGSMASELDERRAQILAKAFSKLKYKVLWKYKKSFPDIKNVKTVTWMPQNDILGHPQLRLFMTHCGSNSVHEGAYHGVPLLATPLWGDQFGFARKCIAAGFAKSIDITTHAQFSAQQIVDLIEELIENPKYKENALRVSKLMKDRPRTPSEEGADWIEYVLRNNGTRHLTPHGIHLSFYQYFLLDVLFFIFFIIFVVFYIMCMCGKYMKNVCCSKTAKEKVQ